MSLHDLYDRLTAHQAFDGSHVSLDRDSQGEEYVMVIPNWIDRTGLGFALSLAQELELSAALTRDGLRFESLSARMVRAVEGVKETLREEAAEPEDEED